MVSVKNILSEVFCLILWCQACLAQGDHFVTLSTVKARPVAMGGAFTAIIDDLPAIDYNPACFNLYDFEKEHRLTFFINPMAPVVALREQIESSKNNQEITRTELLKSLSLLIKAMVFSFRPLDVGVLLSEESLTPPTRLERKQFFSAEPFWNNNSHSVVARLKLARQVSLGLVGTRFSAEDSMKTIQGWSLNYGVLLRSDNSFSLGVVYISLPQKLPHYRTPLEKMVDDTINLGLSYQLSPVLILSMDVRNISADQKRLINQLRFGFDSSPFSWIALRGGYFEEIKGKRTISLGTGLFDLNRFFHPEARFDHKNFLINYSFVYEYQKGVTPVSKWHFFSFILRL
ncbi:MAG: hypothetical protein ONB05_10500 [candidate division KSB1 bacterium]|nr:hypothetical protein [candidate division KSB1 bacterium]